MSIATKSSMMKLHMKLSGMELKGGRMTKGPNILFWWNKKICGPLNKMKSFATT
jgi:hypothetical protein